MRFPTLIPFTRYLHQLFISLNKCHVFLKSLN